MLKEIRNWLEFYAKPGYPDNRAVIDFIECETREVLNSFKAELIGIKNGNIDQKILETILGKKREIQYESYKNWATLMMIWMNDATKQ